jgi:hypothetical protein
VFGYKRLVGYREKKGRGKERKKRREEEKKRRDKK